jgi:hypothetical protein
MKVLHWKIFKQAKFEFSVFVAIIGDADFFLQKI